MKKFITVLLVFAVALTAFATNYEFDVVGRSGLRSTYDVSTGSSVYHSFGGVAIDLIQAPEDNLRFKAEGGLTIYGKESVLTKNDYGWVHVSETDYYGVSLDLSAMVGVEFPIKSTATFTPSVGITSSWEIDPESYFSAGICADGKLAVELNQTTKFFVGYSGVFYFYDDATVGTDKYVSSNSLIFGFHSIVE